MLHLRSLLAPVALALAGCPAAGTTEAQQAVQERSLAAAALPIRGSAEDYSPLLAAIANARVIALGEATHGTHEFYRERARITEELVDQRGFGALVVEADWPEMERVNRYVRGLGADRTAEQALRSFTRFPQWMWRNAEFRDLVERLRTRNLPLPPAQRVGVYGMDVYNLFGAADAVLAHLRASGSAGEARARAHYRCFARHRPDPHRYGTATRRPARSCQAAAAAVLAELRATSRPAEPSAAEARFAAIRSAASVVSAEAYFRTLYAGTSAWNVRDRRMADTVADIADHIAAGSGRPARLVIWAHNSHVGDARATQASERGELNLGQLLRERYGSSAFLLGFLTHSGSVVAADEWDAPGRVRTLRPALADSYAGLLHKAGVPDGMLLLAKSGAAARLLAGPRIERAVGVVYAPETERESHYFRADLARQFDAIIYFDRTRALTPLR